MAMSKRLEYDSAVKYFKESPDTKDLQIVRWLSEKAFCPGWEVFHLDIDDWRCIAYAKRRNDES
jgi:hypothetical protein